MIYNPYLIIFLFLYNLPFLALLRILSISNISLSSFVREVLLPFCLNLYLIGYFSPFWWVFFFKFLFWRVFLFPSICKVFFIWSHFVGLFSFCNIYNYRLSFCMLLVLLLFNCSFMSLIYYHSTLIFANTTSTRWKFISFIGFLFFCMECAIFNLYFILNEF